MKAALTETPIRAGDFPARIRNSLHAAHITTYEQLAQCSRAELLTLRRIGPQTLAVLEEELRARGFAPPKNP